MLGNARIDPRMDGEKAWLREHALSIRAALLPILLFLYFSREKMKKETKLSVD